MDELEIKRMTAVLEAHGQFEIERDLDGTMSTVAANPVYEFVSTGWRIEGRDAVREMYRRLFAGVNNKVISAETRSVTAAENTLCHEGYTVREAADGTRHTCRSATIAIFDGDLVAGERVYADEYMTKINLEAFGDDFGDVPGVSRL